MPELPDVTIYIEALEKRILGQTLERVRVVSPFLLRTATPPLGGATGKKVLRLRRLGKRIAIGLEGDLWLVLHLMIAGRLHWRAAPPKLGTKGLMAVFHFDSGILTFTEAGSQHRASLHVVHGEENLGALDAGGVEPLDVDGSAFARALQSENHTLKRALTDARLFSGIGNAYSDEILHRAGLSPVTLTARLTLREIDRLHQATQDVLTEWV